ncbi:X-ray repair cross-complementing protein 5-like [Babylonia areolata]|uniref:X-ray repair cross-complementing protein 5-like n=1 Tax=Babylonia areolata TaxID=304850 RepID=UPI003FD4044D
MAATKEAIAIVLDVGPSMCSAAPGEATSLQMAIQAITMILQRKMFSESKDEVALVLFGTQDTENPLVDGDSYEHVSIARHLAVADFELLQMVQNDIQPGDSPADFIDAMVVAMDHMESGLQGKRGFGSKRLIVLSDLASPFGDDQLETVMDVIQKFNVEINFIGPDLDDEEEDKGEGGGGGGEGGASSGGGGGGGQKEKTPQQRAGEAMAKYMLEKTGGASYSFNEALPALSYFQSRQVRPTAWKCVLEIGPNLKIPINGYIKVKEFKLKQSWKRVYAKDPDMAVKTERTFHLDDEEKTEVDRDDIVEGYCYGSDRVPMTAEDKESMKYQSEKCLKVLGFTKAENVRRSHYMGDSCLSVSAEKGDEAAAVALSALINALYETNCVAIARRVYAARNAPRIGCLLPQIKAGYECLYWIELPFAEDLRTYTFGSLPTKDNIAFNKKYAPSEEQLTAVDNLITSMDLSTAAEDEDGEKCEAFKPKLMFNPYFQRVYQVTKLVVSDGSWSVEHLDSENDHDNTVYDGVTTDGGSETEARASQDSAEESGIQENREPDMASSVTSDEPSNFSQTERETDSDSSDSPTLQSETSAGSSTRGETQAPVDYRLHPVTWVLALGILWDLMQTIQGSLQVQNKNRPLERPLARSSWILRMHIAKSQVMPKVVDND